MAPTLVEFSPSVLLSERSIYKPDEIVSDRVNVKNFIAALDELNTKYRNRNTDPVSVMFDQHLKLKHDVLNVNGCSLNKPKLLTNAKVSVEKPICVRTDNSVTKSISKKQKITTYSNTKRLDGRLFHATQRLKQLQARGLSNQVLHCLHKSTDLLSEYNGEQSNNHPSLLPDQSFSRTEKQICRKISADTKILKDIDLDTDNELDLRLDVPTIKSKKKVDRPAPPSSDLLAWKECRSRIGSRCSWLDMKIDGLEKQIQRYGKLRNKLRSRKTTSHLDNEDLPECTPTHTEMLDRLSAEEVTRDDMSTQDVADGAARTRLLPTITPRCYVKGNDFRKTADGGTKHSYTCNKSTILPCQLCYQANMDTARQIPVNIMAMRLDHCYSSSLSFINDACLSVHMAKILLTDQINTEVRMSKSTKKKQDELTEPNKDLSFDKAERLRSRGSARIREGKTADIHNNEKSLNIDSLRASLTRKRKVSEASTSSKPDTPLSGRSSPVAGMKKKKNASDAYDIDNIVIPYSVAAATRVERLQCKEIPTPGWRYCAMQQSLQWTNLSELSSLQELDEHETTDDESMLERHERCVLKERSRASTFYETLRPPARSRQSRTSSECYTPGAQSPTLSNDFADDSSLVNTPVHSPELPSGKLSRSHPPVEVTLMPFTKDERKMTWTRRSYPLATSECRTSIGVCHANTINSDTELIGPVHKPTTLHILNNYNTALNASKCTSTSPQLSPFRFTSPLQSPSPTFRQCTPPNGSLPSDHWTVEMVNESTDEMLEKARKSIVLKLAKK